MSERADELKIVNYVVDSAIRQVVKNRDNPESILRGNIKILEKYKKGLKGDDLVRAESSLKLLGEQLNYFVGQPKTCMEIVK